MLTPPTDITALQTELNAHGYGPLVVDGQYGPQTKAAYERYLRTTHPAIEPVVPAAEIPWWASRSMLGALSVILATLSGLAGWAVDAGRLGDVLSMLVTLIGGLMALYGTWHRKGAIDQTAVLPGVRLVQGELVATKDPSGANDWDSR